MVGIYKCMGDKGRQNKVVTLEVVHRLMYGLEGENSDTKTDVIINELSDMAVFVLASFLVALREEKTLKISLGETREFFEEAERHSKHGHVILLLRGIFKGDNRENCHFVTVNSLTNAGLRLGP